MKWIEIPHKSINSSACVMAEGGDDDAKAANPD